jgi:putative transposase
MDGAPVLIALTTTPAWQRVLPNQSPTERRPHHQSNWPFRRRERAMLRFRQMKTLQKFASVHASLHNHLLCIVNSRATPDGQKVLDVAFQ